MPAFTLYGGRGSTNTDRVRLTLAEGGFTDYELVLLDLRKGEQKVSSIQSYSTRQSPSTPLEADPIPNARADHDSPVRREPEA